MREIGVLIIVFVPLDSRLTVTRVTAIVVGAALLVIVGMILEAEWR